MVNMQIWLGLLFTAFIATLIVGKMGKAKPWSLFVASLVGILTRVVQFIIISLFVKYTPSLAIPRILFGIVITAILILGFIFVPFLPYLENKNIKSNWLSYGLFFYMGYFAAGFVQSYLGWLMLSKL